MVWKIATKKQISSALFIMLLLIIPTIITSPS